MFGPLRFLVMLQKLYPFWRDAAQIEKSREKRLRALLKHAVERSPYYRERFAGLDVSRCGLSELPTLSKAEMMENFDELVTDPRLRKAELSEFVDNPVNLGRYYLGKYGVSHTSGSQGQPALIVQDREALALVFAAQFARVLPHLGRLIDPARMAVMTVQPGFYPSASAFAYLPWFLKPVFKVLHLTVSDPMADNIRKIEEFRPDYITGYASSLEAFGREEAEGRMNLSELGCLKQITNVAEPLSPKAGAWLENIFGAHVSDEYAMGECMALSSGCVAGRGAHVNSDLAILEVVDENNQPVPPGTEGARVLVTNLYNHVQPIIRYEIDDRVTMATAACNCGSLLPRIEKISGRSKDLLFIETGGERREVPYYLFLTGLHHVLEMAEHQIVQTGPKSFLIRAVPLAGQSIDTARVRQLVMDQVAAEGLEGLVDIDIEIVPGLPRGPSARSHASRTIMRSVRRPRRPLSGFHAPSPDASPGLLEHDLGAVRALGLATGEVSAALTEILPGLRDCALHGHRLAVVIAGGRALDLDVERGFEIPRHLRAARHSAAGELAGHVDDRFLAVAGQFILAALARVLFVARRHRVVLHVLVDAERHFLILGTEAFVHDGVQLPKPGLAFRQPLALRQGNRAEDTSRRGTCRHGNEPAEPHVWNSR
jgi:phenylacetate-CoA ligase